MKRIIGMIVPLGILYACGGGEDSSKTTLADVQENIVDEITPDWKVYEGTVPCADCEAIHMQLWLEDDEHAVSPDYRMVMNYENTPVGDEEVEITGIYTVVSGYAQDRDAIVYQLNPGTSEPRYFVRNDDQSLTMLGENMQRLEEEGDQSFRLELRETE